jgi:hypothetical protein
VLSGRRDAEWMRRFRGMPMMTSWQLDLLDFRTLQLSIL